MGSGLMSQTITVSRGTQLLLVLASFVIVVAGMREAAPVLIPLSLAVFIAIICWPPLYWLKRAGLPSWAAVLLIVVGLVVLMSVLAAIVGSSIDGFVRNLPVYQVRLTREMADLFDWVENHGVHVSEAVLIDYLDPGKLMGVVGNTISKFGSVFTNTLMILFTVVFIFFEAFVLPAKMKIAFGNEIFAGHFDHFVASVRRYLGIKSATSAVTGVAVTGLLIFLKVDFPILWGLIAFLLNFIPNIGSIIAAIPAVMLASVQLGFGPAAYVALGYLVINIGIGSLIEPRMMGRGLGLSPLVVFLSLIFWGWVFGPTGMFLSVPFTMIFKIALENSESTRWIAVLLGGDPTEIDEARVH